MLAWLRSWGCRQFAKNYDPLATSSILDWYRDNRNRVPCAGLTNLTDEALQEAASANDLLSKSHASRKRGRIGGLHDVSFGPTGAAKILYALCPEALPPWDGAIRNRLGHGRARNSYLSFLRDVQRIICGLVEEAEKKELDEMRFLKKSGVQIRPSRSW
jgi:hypothetical protein